MDFISPLLSVFFPLALLSDMQELKIRLRAGCAGENRAYRKQCNDVVISIRKVARNRD